MSIQVTFTPVSLPNYENMVNKQKTNRFTVNELSSLSAISSAPIRGQRPLGLSGG